MSKPARKPALPRMREKTVNGYTYAIVTLTDSETGRRRDVTLGRADSHEAHRNYAKTIERWQRNGKRIESTGDDNNEHVDDSDDDRGITVDELVKAYTLDAKERYGASQVAMIAMALRPLAEYSAGIRADDIGPNWLRDLRNQIVAGRLFKTHCSRPSRRWTRSTINRVVRMWIRLYRWAVAHELVEERTLRRMEKLEPLRAGQTTAPETEPVRPVDENIVTLTIAHLPPIPAAVVRLLQATGMRPSEALAMRACDIDMSGPTWIYTPRMHKNTWRGQGRTVPLGPKARAIITSFLGGATSDFLFPGADVDDVRRRLGRAERSAAGQGVETGSGPIVAMRPAFGVSSLRLAINRASDAANRQALADAARAGREVLPGVRLVPRWHPYQLRHSVATAVAHEHGHEAATAVLGHASPRTAEIYVERNEKLAVTLAEKHG